MGEKGEGSGGKGGGNWEWGTPLSTPSSIVMFVSVSLQTWPQHLSIKSTKYNGWGGGGGDGME